MSSKSQLDLMSIFQQNQESVLKGIQKFAKDIFVGNDEEAKKKLCKNLHEITKICHCSNDFQKSKNQPLLSRKRFEKFENEPQIAKKKKLECKKLPNELWLKIMNYLNTKDLMTNMALVCKTFNSLTKDVNYLELKEITELKFESAIKLLKTTTHLKAIRISTRFTSYLRNHAWISEDKRNFMKLLYESLKSSKTIKSIKLEPFLGSRNSSYELAGFKQIKTICANLEHLHLRNMILTKKCVTSQIAQISSLKSLRLSFPSSTQYGTSFTPNNILEFSKCSNLEAISFYINISPEKVNEMKNAFDTFFTARKHTLKSFEISRFFKFKDKKQDILENPLLENITLCQNLEELSMRDFKLDQSTLANILTLQKLQTLVLQKGTLSNTYLTGIVFGGGGSMANLKYLKLGYDYINGSLRGRSSMKLKNFWAMSSNIFGLKMENFLAIS